MSMGLVRGRGAKMYSMCKSDEILPQVVINSGDACLVGVNGECWQT